MDRPAPFSRHQPVRPTWVCAACGAEWPCVRRRDELLDDCDGSVTGVALAMSSYLNQALDDTPDVLARALYMRFLAWVRPHALLRRHGRG